MSPKTIRIKVNNVNFGWIQIRNGLIVACSERHKWALHHIPDKLINWCRKFGTVTTERM
jgi:hypothetical protein